MVGPNRTRLTSICRLGSCRKLFNKYRASKTILAVFTNYVTLIGWSVYAINGADVSRLPLNRFSGRSSTRVRSCVHPPLTHSLIRPSRGRFANTLLTRALNRTLKSCFKGCRLA